MTEDRLGQIMLKRALAEGHRPRMPASVTSQKKPVHFTRLFDLIVARGMTHKEAAKEMGIARSRVTQLVAEYGLKP